MNVTGVTSAPLPAPVPAVIPPQRTTRSSTDADPTSREAAALRAAQEKKPEPVKVPPLKPLSTTEIRVILGAIPPGHAAQQDPAGLKGGSFDAYV